MRTEERKKWKGETERTGYENMFVILSTTNIVEHVYKIIDFKFKIPN